MTWGHWGHLDASGFFSLAGTLGPSAAPSLGGLLAGPLSAHILVLHLPLLAAQIQADLPASILTKARWAQVSGNGSEFP